MGRCRNLGLLKSFFWYISRLSGASLVAQLVKNLPAMQETWVWSLGWEDALEKERLPTPVFWPREFQKGVAPILCVTHRNNRNNKSKLGLQATYMFLQFFYMYVWLSHLASKHKFVCLTYSEAKPTETLKFGAGKGLLKSHARRWFAYLPNPQPCTLWKFSASIFEGQVREGFCRVCGQLLPISLIGGRWGNRMVSRGLTLSVLRIWEAWGYVLMVIR